MVETDIEELELELIDYGVEEVFVDEGNAEEEEPATIMIYGSFENYGAIQGAIEEKNLEIISSGFERIPTDTKKLTPEQEADVEKLLERLEDDEDVQSVYHNMA